MERPHRSEHGLHGYSILMDKYAGELKAELDAIRKALDGYPDSDLASLAETTWRGCEQAGRLREALENLVKKLDLVHKDGCYKSVWTLAFTHFGQYTGLQYHEELEAARKALYSYPDSDLASLAETVRMGCEQAGRLQEEVDRLKGTLKDIKVFCLQRSYLLPMEVVMGMCEEALKGDPNAHQD